MKAVINRPREDVVYAVFAEFLAQHKEPHTRFIIYPQLSLKWNPEDERDKRAEVPDIGVGNFTLPGADPPFKLRFGVEAKRSIGEMDSLPSATSIITQDGVVRAFHALLFQAKNQAKAAIKSQYAHDNTVQWILLIGPYWMPVTFGPFTAAELTVRAHKPSPSADWLESVKEARSIDSLPPPLPELFLLCESASTEHLEAVIASTDAIAEPLINALTCSCLYTTTG